MKTFVKIVMVSATLVFLASLGCGGDTNGKTDTLILPSPPDAGPPLIVDAELDKIVVQGPDAKEVVLDPADVSSDTAVAGSGCVGLSPDECHIFIINPPADPSVMEQDVPGPVPPAYLTCISQ